MRVSDMKESEHSVLSEDEKMAEQTAAASAQQKPFSAREPVYPDQGSPSHKNSRMHHPAAQQHVTLTRQNISPSDDGTPFSDPERQPVSKDQNGSFLPSVTDEAKHSVPADESAGAESGAPEDTILPEAVTVPDTDLIPEAYVQQTADAIPADAGVSEENLSEREYSFRTDDEDETEREDETESAFLRSLDEMTPEDICPDAPAESKRGRFDLSDIARYAVMGVCICIFCYCAVYLVRQQHYYNASSSENNSIQQEFWGGQKESDVKSATAEGASPASPDYAKSLRMTEDDYRSFLEQLEKNPINEKFEMIKAKLNSIREKNSDLYGWIKIEGTAIDYPIVQSDDNEYYLTHTYTGGYSPAGSVFADYRCSGKITENYNTILYAHHMASGSTMFHSLDNYFNETFFRENPYIYIYTLDGIYTFEVFAVYVTDVSYPYIKTSFNTDEEFTEFAKDLQSRSLYVREGLTFEKNEHILTLSTCTNLVKTDRIAVQAKLIQIES